MIALPGPSDEPTLDDDLAAWGKVLLLETRGRHSGLPRRVVLGFIDPGDGSLLVAASDEDAHWALNLLAEPRCLVERDGVASPCRASRVDDWTQRATVAALILKYGTPAERLGGGPAFRLVPVAEGNGLPHGH